MKKVMFLGVEYEVSDYIKFIARDMDGEVWGFDVQPELKSGTWYARNGCNEFLTAGDLSPICEEIK